MVGMTMRRALLPAIVGFALAGAAQAQLADPMKNAEAVAWFCESQDALQLVACFGFLRGAIETHVMFVDRGARPIFCLPANASVMLDEYRVLYVDALLRDPLFVGFRPGPPSIALFAVLGIRFPCR